VRRLIPSSRLPDSVGTFAAVVRHHGQGSQPAISNWCHHCAISSAAQHPLSRLCADDSVQLNLIFLKWLELRK
jgi:hypothetical protein